MNVRRDADSRWDWDLNPGVREDTCSQGRRVGPLRYPTRYALRWFDPIRNEVDWSSSWKVPTSPRGEKLNLSFSALLGNGPDHCANPTIAFPLSIPVGSQPLLAAVPEGLREIDRRQLFCSPRRDEPSRGRSRTHQ